MKKIISLILLLSIVLPSVCVADEEPEYKGFGYEHKIESTDPIYFCDFENFHLGRDAEKGFDRLINMNPYPTKGVDESVGFAYNGYGEPTIVLDNVLNQGTYVFSFDVKRAYIAQSFWIRYNSNSQGVQVDNAFGIKNNLMGKHINWNIQNGIEYKAGEWAHIAIYLDFDNRISYYVADNKYISNQAGLEDIYSITFMALGASDMVTAIDNIALFEFDTVFRAELINKGITVPDELAEDIECSITSDYPGNLFTEFDDVKLTITHKNRLESNIEYNAKYIARDYRGDVVWQEEKEFTLTEGEIIYDEIFPNVTKYDIYTLYVTLTPKTNNPKIINLDREFSVVNSPSDGYRNYKFGFHTHPGRHTDFDTVKYAVDKCGIGFLRTDGWNWGGYIKRGEKMEAETKTDFFTKCTQMNIENIVFLEAQNPVVSTDYREIAKSPELLKQVEDGMAEIAAKYKGRIDYWETGNEVNFKRIDVLPPEEYAIVCAAQYRGFKRGNPDCTVLSPGLSRSAPDWIYKFLTATKEPVCDVVAIHTYQETNSPESKKWTEYNNQAREAMKRAGYSDMELWVTECASAASIQFDTEQQHAVDIIRHFSQAQAYGAAEKVLPFQLQCEESNTADNEQLFGVLRGPASKNGYGPKPAYMAITNYIAMTENAEFESDIQYDNVYIIRFKRSDGSRILMMYANRDCKLTSLQLGAKTGTLYDIYGNPEEIASETGEYTFSLTDQPIYFEYKGDKFELCEGVISTDVNLHKVALGNTEAFNLEIPENANIFVENKDNLSVSVLREGKNACLEFSVKALPELTFISGIGNRATAEYTKRDQDTGTETYRDFIDVRVEYGISKQYIRLPIEYKFEPADVIMKVKPYDTSNTKYIKAEITVKNNLTKAISGKIQLKNPEKLAQQISDIEVLDILPKESKTIKFNIPLEFTGDEFNEFSGVFICDEGVSEFALADVPDSYYKAPQKVNIKALERTGKKTPLIDGVIDEDEWKGYKLCDFDKSQVSFGSQGVNIAGVVEKETFGKDADYGGKADFSGTIYSQWDDKFLYVAALVYDDVHFQVEDPVRFYYDDHLSIQSAPTMTQRHQTRIDVALSDYFNSDIYDESERKSVAYVNWSHLFDVPVSGIIPESEEGCMTKVIRKDNVTIYETRIPWERLADYKTVEDRQLWLDFSIRDYDGDRDKTYRINGWYMLTNTNK